MRYCAIIFVMLFVCSPFLTAATITRIEVLPANGKTRIKLYMDTADVRYFDVFDKTSNKLIVKVLNTSIASSYSRTFTQSDIKVVRAARNNPQDVWVVAECTVPYLTKEHSVQKEGSESVLLYDIYFPIRSTTPPQDKQTPVTTKPVDKTTSQPVTTQKTTTTPITTPVQNSPTIDRTMRTTVENETGMATVISIKTEEALIVRIRTGGADDVGIEDAVLKRLIDASEYEKARILLNEYARKYPEHAAYFFEKIGELYLKESDFTRAREYYRKAYDGYKEKSQDKSRAAYFVAQVSFTLNQYQDAVHYSDYALAHSTITQVLFKTYMLRGDVFESRKDIERALDSFNRALNSATSTADSADVLYKLYRIYRDRKDYKAAHMHLTKLIASGLAFQPARKKELDFDNADLYYLLTERDKAVLAYKDIISIYAKDPDVAWAYYQLGTIYKSMNNTKEAIEYFNTLVATYPTSYWAEHARFHVKSMMNTYNEKKQ